MTDPFKPVRLFTWREEVEKYIEETGRGTWQEVKEFAEGLVDAVCLRSSRDELLIIPKHGKRRLLGKAKLYASYIAFRDEFRRTQDEDEPSHPLETGFLSYQADPPRISELARRCAELIGARFSGSWASLLAQADRWLGKQFAAGTAGDLLEDPEKICMLCALAGEAIRERSKLRLVWTVRTENSIGALGATLYAADLIAPDGRICEVSIPLVKQIADPDYSSPSKILRTFVDFQVKHAFA